MDDDAVGYGDLADRHLPVIGRGLQQHHAGGGAAAADIVVRGADAAAAAGSHLAPDALAGKVRSGGDLLGLDFLPVAFELLADELDEAGDRALAHFRARDPDHAGIIGLDHDPGIDLGAVIGALRQHRADTERQVESEREPTARSGGADNELAARKFRGFAAHDLFHGRPHYVLDMSLAAICTAVRMRW